MPPLVLTIVALIQAAITLGPDIAKLYDQAKALFNMLFAGGLITVQQQKTLMDWADAHMTAVLAGEVPPELTVEPDPQ